MFKRKIKAEKTTILPLYVVAPSVNFCLTLLLYKDASHLIQPGIIGHLGQRFPDDKHFRTLLSNLKLMEPGNKEVEESQY